MNILARGFVTIAACLALPGLLAPAALAENRTPYLELEKYKPFGTVHFDGMSGGFASTQAPQFTKTVAAPAAGQPFALFFSAMHADSNSAASIRIEDPSDGEVLQSWKVKDFGSHDRLLSSLIYNNSVNVSINIGSNDHLSFDIAQLVQRLPSSGFSSQAVGANWEAYQDLPAADPLTAWSRSVAKLHVGDHSAVCTGFLVGRDLLLTAYHCLEHSIEFVRTKDTASRGCNDIKAEFDYRLADRPGASPFATCKTVLVFGNYPHKPGDADQGDFALLRFDASELRLPEDATRERPHFAIATQPITNHAWVDVIQHPWGWPIQFAKCTVTDQSNRLTILYGCNTTDGSSGSPVISDNSGAVVAIHVLSANVDPADLSCLNSNDWACPHQKPPQGVMSAKNGGTRIQAIWPSLEPFIH